MNDWISHHGILGMKWGVRRYQNKNGSLTKAGKKRVNKSSTGILDKISKKFINASEAILKNSTMKTIVDKASNAVAPMANVATKLTGYKGTKFAKTPKGTKHDNTTAYYKTKAYQQRKVFYKEYAQHLATKFPRSAKMLAKKAEFAKKIVPSVYEYAKKLGTIQKVNIKDPKTGNVIQADIWLLNDD